MARKFALRGVDVERLKQLSLDDFIPMCTSKIRRTLLRMSPEIQNFLEHLKKADPAKPFKTHVREMPIIPSMIGFRFQVYNGKEWVDVIAKAEMLGKRLGEFSIPIKMVKHSAAGIGATRGSKAIELK